MVTEIDRPPTLTAVVVDAIRDAILRGDMLPGRPLREVKLSEQLDVSRGTVRDALRQLQDDGLVEVVPHRGAFVRNLTPRTARELYTLRAVLEPYAVRLALENDAYTEDDLAAMAELGRRVDELEQRTDATYETVSVDVEFHRQLCTPSGHQLLLDVFSSLQALSWLFVFNTKLYQSDAYSDEPSHYEVFQSIQRGDPDLAADTVREHIEQAGSALLARMEELHLNGPGD